jgi:hypothetical protein
MGDFMVVQQASNCRLTKQSRAGYQIAAYLSGLFCIMRRTPVSRSSESLKTTVPCQYVTFATKTDDTSPPGEKFDA